jgi:ferredoxin
MRIEIDYDLCESNGVCMGIAPEVFEIRDDDNLYVLLEDIPPELADQVTDAARSCPKQAIRTVS